MDKKIRNLLILAGILVLLCIAYAVTGLLVPDETPETEPETQTGTTPLFRVTEDGLTALSFTYDRDDDGTAEFWDFVRSEDGQTWKWTGDGTLPIGSSAFYTHSSTLASVTATKVFHNVTEAQLAEYGLTAPRKTVYFTDRAGGEQSICIGAYNAYNGTYCAYINEDKTTVYLVGGDLVTAFDQPIESLVSYDDLPSFQPEALISLSMTQGEKTVIVTRVIPESETGIDAKAVWLRSVNHGTAVQVSDDLAASLELLVGDMDYLACYSITSEDFAEYGLDQNTTRMTVLYRKNVGGADVETTFTLTLGATDKYGYYYANPDGTPVTMLLGGSVFQKLMTYDDEHLAAGDETTADSAA